VIQDRFHAEQFGYLLGRPPGALQIRGEQLHLGAVRDLGPQRLGNGDRRTDASGRQLRVMPSADDSLDVVRRFRMGDDVKSAHECMLFL
jgi:hypothetical protein